MPRFEVTVGVRVDLAYEVTADDVESACNEAEAVFRSEDWVESIKSLIGGEILSSVAAIATSNQAEPTLTESGEYQKYPCANCGTLAPVPMKHDCLCANCAK